MRDEARIVAPLFSLQDRPSPPFRETIMIITDWIHVIAGSFILLSLALGVDSTINPLFVSRYWLLFTAFVGANLLQFGFTKFCPLRIILKKLGVPENRL
jgi:hypothetical protein